MNAAVEGHVDQVANLHGDDHLPSLSELRVNESTENGEQS